MLIGLLKPEHQAAGQLDLRGVRGKKARMVSRMRGVSEGRVVRNKDCWDEGLDD